MKRTRTGPARFFDSYAHDFDAIYAGGRSPVSRWLNRQLRQSMFLRYEHTLRACTPAGGAAILDVGCGPGHYAIALAQMGAARVLGIDVSQAMLAIARTKAHDANVEARCEFECIDFLKLPDEPKFDFVILMGFMDYVEVAQPVIHKAVSLARRSALFSFPAREGFLAWQRRMRYRLKTPLYMYSREDLDTLFQDLSVERVQSIRIARDYFVSVDTAS
jgi:SAM-dependent methyltransferase